MNLCVLCRQSFKDWNDYHDHMTGYHGHLISKAEHMLPRNTSGRDRVTIVREAEETWLRPYLIMDTVTHNDECRCDSCFQKQLDALISSQEESLNQEVNHAK